MIPQVFYPIHLIMKEIIAFQEEKDQHLENQLILMELKLIMKIINLNTVYPI